MANPRAVGEGANRRLGKIIIVSGKGWSNRSRCYGGKRHLGAMGLLTRNHPLLQHEGETGRDEHNQRRDQRRTGHASMKGRGGRRTGLGKLL